MANLRRDRIITFLLLLGILSAALLTYKFAAPYLVYFLSESESVPKHWKIPPLYLFITVHFLILVVWKLRGLQHPDPLADDPKPVTHEAIHNPPPPPSSPPPSLADDVIETEPPCSVTEENSDEQQQWPPPEEEMAEEEENVSMDAIWKAITGGASKNDQHLIKKSDTWEKSKATTGEKEMRKSETFREKASTAATGAVTKTKTKTKTQKKDMRKSETFREESSSSSPVLISKAGGWRGRDRLLLVQDDLFGKVEAFIKMNRDQMRVNKRQESSDHRYVEMVNAAY